LTSTAAEADELARRARAELVTLGRVEEDGIPLKRSEDLNKAGIGDLIMARRNMRGIKDQDGRKITNRDVLEIVDRVDGPFEQVTVRRYLGRDAEGIEQWDQPYSVSVDYIKEHTQLAYAATAHAAQGRTVDTVHSLVREGLSRAHLYVMMTRGRL